MGLTRTFPEHPSVRFPSINSDLERQRFIWMYMSTWVAQLRCGFADSCLGDTPWISHSQSKASISKLGYGIVGSNLGIQHFRFGSKPKSFLSAQAKLCLRGSYFASEEFILYVRTS